MRLLKLFLFVLLVVLQYRLWFGKNSLPEYWHLQEDVARQEQTNQKLRQRNQVLIADIEDLREGEVALEERARNELGLIKQDETFFRLIPVKPKTYDEE
ncbi:cell division protein FtsB [Pseudidiomarina terrestris]|uniref:Cell division protein FtsB n=1 Tax=Pseudidiomarina terrestris TaxID=2820060 RepID=A0AAW7QTI9_9GAMM|nr:MULTISPECIES: cell division protein FtsB [unclassified Pseudidiomarina]MDN7123596.1 cell division protein FtsB [Pseudidiomarina sp. 1APP75-32.1]MDN7126614.1 cell division protein FtsB [Pseudidiomarina sp. 1APR75-33.1]MDN7128680.1 cell division protein FtsB [Pseudidiomarina sp. 1APR75-15]MDN7135061.1 cell division protein FtsB [Pseudidiomarina sp. 1ASP75-5]MDN7137732.1 cell division protein FtsB [Pseudidiomarina sp. 1ASP75-14]